MVKENINVIQYPPPEKSEGKLRCIGGSKFDPFNDLIVNDIVKTLWLPNGITPERKQELMQGALSAAIGIKPESEIEGMLVAQMVATHSAAVECFRRGMISEQTIEGRSMNLSAANKLTRSFAHLVEALNRHRGKGGQRVTVEHVHVHSGGQAIVGTVGVGASQKSGKQCHALPHAPGETMRSENAEGLALPVSGGQRAKPLPNAWRHKSRGAEGQPQRMASRPMVKGGN